MKKAIKLFGIGAAVLIILMSMVPAITSNLVYGEDCEGVDCNALIDEKNQLEQEKDDLEEEEQELLDLREDLEDWKDELEQEQAQLTQEQAELLEEKNELESRKNALETMIPEAEALRDLYQQLLDNLNTQRELLLDELEAARQYYEDCKVMHQSMLDMVSPDCWKDGSAAASISTLLMLIAAWRAVRNLERQLEQLDLEILVTQVNLKTVEANILLWNFELFQINQRLPEIDNRLSELDELFAEINAALNLIDDMLSYIDLELIIIWDRLEEIENRLDEINDILARCCTTTQETQAEQVDCGCSEQQSTY